MTEPRSAGLLHGVRVVECSLLEPGALGLMLADLGAEVIKVEAPGGDYVRRMAWPFVEGTSLLHWHINRGKRSIELDLRNPAAVDVFLELVRVSDVVIEAMRPGGLARRGLGFERLREINPRIVMCTLSGWGSSGPYRDLPSHGIGFDAWAGIAPPAVDDEGMVYMSDHTTVGTRVGPLWAALGVCAAVVRARSSGEGCLLDVSQSDAAASVNWLRIEGYRAYERPETEVTGNPADGGVRREPGVGGMRGAVRYQYYRTTDGHVLLMASEREFWENFCVGVGRRDLFDQHPGTKYADHAVGDRVLQRELQAIFAGRSTQEWVEFGLKHNCPICPVNDSRSIAADPQFAYRFPWLPASEYVADLMPSPIKVVGESPPRSWPAPAPGQHTGDVMASVLGLDEARIAELRDSGAFGPVEPSGTQTPSKQD